MAFNHSKLDRVALMARREKSVQPTQSRDYWLPGGWDICIHTPSASPLHQKQRHTPTNFVITLARSIYKPFTASDKTLFASWGNANHLLLLFSDERAKTLHWREILREASKCLILCIGRAVEKIRNNCYSLGENFVSIFGCDSFENVIFSAFSLLFVSACIFSVSIITNIYYIEIENLNCYEIKPNY